jgi:EAL domain-containing protein (putative c-di-GMP-specific phosphodiesterase class I)
MEFRVVAEQVERQEDFDWLRDVGVDYVQGYFVDRPVNLGSMGTGVYRTLNP